jgi:hypothetical protein
MSLDPFSTRPLELSETKLGETNVKEIEASSLDRLLGAGIEAQKRVARLPLEERLSVFGSLVELWKRKLSQGMLRGLIIDLAKSTGYSEKLVESECMLVCNALDPENIHQNLKSSLGDPDGLTHFVETSQGEYLRYMPAGPVFIISSGNSLIPPLIPTALSIATGNFTLLRPSLSNYRGIREIFNQILEIDTVAARLLSELLVIGYFGHDSPSLAHMLGKSRVGVINFWGGEPARTEVCRRVSENPHHPRLVINGPLTGVAIVDEASADSTSADGLAKNMVLYDQQLCSSPTSAIFLGSHGMALEFAKLTAERLDAFGRSYPMQIPDGVAFILQSARRVLQFKGSTVLSSQDPLNMWTIVVSSGSSTMDEIVTALPDFGLHLRRRFLEIISVGDVENAMALIGSLPLMKAFRGIDKIQTAGIALSAESEAKIAERLAESGVFRIVPLRDMYMRSPSEPYDGVGIPSSFTYAVYRRKKELNLGESS